MIGFKIYYRDITNCKENMKLCLAVKYTKQWLVICIILHCTSKMTSAYKMSDIRAQ